MKPRIRIILVGDHFASFWMDREQYNRLTGLNIPNPMVGLAYTSKSVSGELHLMSGGIVLKMELKKTLWA